MNLPPITRTLADYAASGSTARISRNLRDSVELLVADYLGVALRGSQTVPARILADSFGENHPGQHPCTLIGRPASAESSLAAMVNAVASHSIELDDVDRLALFHFSPPVVSAALAVGERVGASGAELIDAVIVGCEVMARLSAAMNTDLRDSGFHTTPVCGIFGAAAASGRLLGAGSDTLASAFGLAGAQAGGLMQMYGPSMQKRFNPGPAARDGVLSAALAVRGFTGATDIFEGERGVIRAFTGREPDSICLDGLGSESWIEIEFKPYACARPIHNAIDAGLELRSRVGNVAQIEEVRLERHPDWADYHLIPQPRTYHEAQVSVNYGVALALVRGSALFDDFVETVGIDERVSAISSMVRVVPQPALKRGVSCKLLVITRGGDRLERTVDYPKGSLEVPMGRTEIEKKFKGLVEPFGVEVGAGAWEVASRATSWNSVSEALELLPVSDV